MPDYRDRYAATDRKPGRKPSHVDDWARSFIAAIMMGHSVVDAAIQAGVAPSTPYVRKKHDKKFGEAWKEAADIGTEFLEQEAARRAYHGTIEPVFNKGVECGTVRKYSDILMMFLLKSRKPETYKDAVPSVVVNNKNVTVNIFDDIEHNIKLIEQASQATVDTETDSRVRENGVTEPLPEAQSDSAEGEPEAD